MNSDDQFEAIVSEHYQALYRFAMSLTRSESDAQDLAQQTFYIWATKGHQLRDTSKIKTWLFTTLHRLFLKSRRKDDKYSHANLEEVSEQLPVVSPELPEQMDWSQVLLALARVDEVYQAAVVLFYLQDWPYKEIAVVLNIPIGTVKSRISRGVAQLREMMLSEKPEGSFANDDAVNSVPATGGPRAPGGNNPSPHFRANREGCPDEWDLSSTCFGEPFASF